MAKDYNIQIPAPLTASEELSINHYQTLRTSIHDGPLYTKAPPRDPATIPKIFGEDQANEIFAERGRTDIDPFVGVPTYTMKYEKKERAMPQLSGRPFIKEFFPQELEGTLDGSDGHGGKVAGATKKKLILATGLSVEEKNRLMLEKIGEATEDAADDAVAEEEEEEQEEDYDYEEDEEEMGGDYDAEQYFEDGDDDGDDDAGGGGGDDY